MSDSKRRSRKRRASFLKADFLSVTAEPLATDFAMFLTEGGCLTADAR